MTRRDMLATIISKLDLAVEDRHAHAARV